MSGIVGLWRLDGQPVDRGRFAEAMSAMEHRGPDGSAVLVDGNFALGQLLMRTTPEDSPRARVEKSGRYTLVSDARVDNRAELIRQLGLSPSEATSDSQLILAAFERWGEESPNYLIGDFAFVVWDADRRRLFCARDVMGVRPFYYHFTPGKWFAFASEVNALYKLQLESRKLDEEMVALFLAAPQAYMQEVHRTTLKGLYRIPRNHTLELSATSPLRLRPYWEPPDETLQLKDNAAYAEAFRDVFSKAIRSRLRSTTSVGSMLSGGLDSSSITCLARELADDGSLPLHTYSAIYPDLVTESNGEIDERDYIQEVANLEGIEAHYIRADKLGPFYQFDTVVEAFGQLYFGGNAFFHWRAAQLSKQHGHRVLLDGADGDSVVSHGMEYGRELLRRGEWELFKKVVGTKGEEDKLAWEYFNAYGGWEHMHRLAAKGRFLAYWSKSFSGARALGLRPWEMGAGPGASPFALAAVPLQRWFSGEPSVTDSTKNADYDLLSEEMVDAHGDWIRARLKSSTVSGAENKITRRWEGLRQFQHMMETLDVLAAANQVEMRFPFFDRRVLEFCLALPGLQQRQDGLGRFVLRNAMRNTVPEKIRLRGDKGNLTAGFTHGFTRLHPDFVIDAIASGPVELSRLIDISTAENLQKAVRQGDSDASDRNLALYRVIALSRWLSTTAHR